jgi:tRNA-modifying protein YgfZ
MPIVNLTDRGVLELAGEDRVSFLQGLVSNDVTAVAPGRAIFAALLTPQGKWLLDLFLFTDGERLLLESERAAIPTLMQRLGRFRLRARVVMRDVSDELPVLVGWGGAPVPTGIAGLDPRLAEAGWRALGGPLLPADAEAADWDRHRLMLGLPEGSRDLTAEQTVLLEAGHDELHGISWSKGCYMGQELTARTKYRGLVKRRLVPVAVEGPLPPPGTAVSRDGLDLGEMRSGREARGIAQLRLDALAGGPLRCGEAWLRPVVPSWMALP